MSTQSTATPPATAPRPDSPTDRAPAGLSIGVACLIAFPLALAVCWPIFTRPWWENHDMIAYPVRLIEYAQGIRFGNLYPRWAPDLYGGYGAPLFNFYAPGVFTVATPFHLLGASPALALKLAMWLYTAAGLVGTFLIAQAWTQRRDAALLALGVFAFAPYRFTQLLTRGDLAEYCAIAVVPLALLGYLEMRRRGPSLRLGLLTALAHASVMLTHTITGQWFTQLAAVLVLVWVVRDARARDLRAVIVSVVVFGGALGLTSIYTVPALLERDLVRISNMTVGGFAIAKNFIGEMKFLLGQSFFFIGYPLVVAVPCAVLVLAVATPQQRRAILPWAGACAGLIFMMDSSSELLWNLIPLAKFTQFPWRLLGFLAVTGSILAAQLYAAAVSQRSRTTDAALLAILLLLGARAYHEAPLPNPLDERSVPSSSTDVAARMHSTVVSDEYLPLTAPAPPRSLRHRLVEETMVGVNVETALRSGIGFHLIVDVARPGFVDVGQIFFPGWRATKLRGPATPSVGPSPTGMIRVTFPTPGHYDIAIQFHMTPPRIAGAIMSAVAALLLPLLLYFLLRRPSVARPA